MFNVVWKISVCLSVLTYTQVTQGSDSYKCIGNGTYLSLIATRGKPVVEKVANYEASVDDIVIFKCNVTANPAANIWWLYQGQFIEGTGFQNQYSYGQCNETLTIWFATLNDTGNYSCLARNVFGKALSTAGILEVKIKGKTSDTKYTRNVVPTIRKVIIKLEQEIDSRPLCKNLTAFSSVAHCGIWYYTVSAVLFIGYLVLPTNGLM